MSKRKTIVWLGILVAILPFLGFPAAWKSAVYFISGVLIVVNSYQLNKHQVARNRRIGRKINPGTAPQPDETPTAQQEKGTPIVSDITPPYISSKK